MSDDRARQIVEYVVDYVEKAGHFHGRGKDRHLEFGVVLLADGGHREVMDVMAENVALLIDGTATYRQRAGAPEPSSATPAKPTP